MNKNDASYYDNTTEDFFRELNFGQQNATEEFFPIRDSSAQTLNPIKKNGSKNDSFEHNLRLAHSSPRFSHNHGRRRSKSTSRISTKPIIQMSNDQTKAINLNNSAANRNDNNNSSPKFNKVNDHTWTSNDSFARNSSISNLNISNDTFNNQYVQYRNQPPIFRKSKYNHAKTQTLNKKRLEISDSFSVDYYYSSILSFEVDPQSLHASFHKRTKHRKKRENYEQSLNFISKYLPNCEFNTEKIEKNTNSTKCSLISSNFDEEMDRLWQLTLQRFRSMKSTKAVFNSIRLTEFKNYVLTQLINQDENDHNNRIDENQLLKFQIFYKENSNHKKNADILHLYSWQRLLIDPKKIVFSLTQIYQLNFNKASTIDDEDTNSQINEFYIFSNLNICIGSIFRYIILWISLFPTNFVPNEQQTNNGLTFFADDLINLIILIITSFPQFKSSGMVILAVIFFIYNGEIDPLMFSHFPCFKPKIAAKESFEFGRLIDLQVEPQILVKHFTYVELHLLRSVSRDEIINDEKWHQSWHLQALFKRFNDTCSFILTSIIKANKESQIQKLIYWISVMTESMKMRNYQMMFEIETSLSSSLIKDVRSSLPISQSLKFDKMKSFLSSKSCDDDMKQRREVCLPFFGSVFKKVLKLFGDRNGEQKKAEVSFHQICGCVGAVEFLLSEWGTQYTFDLDQSLLNAVCSLDGRIESIDEVRETQT